MATETDNLFVRSLLTEQVLLQPAEIGSDYERVILERLEERFSGKCTLHGYIQPDSIELHRVLAGNIVSTALNGNVQFDVQYFANVCNVSR